MLIYCAVKSSQQSTTSNLFVRIHLETFHIKRFVWIMKFMLSPDSNLFDTTELPDPFAAEIFHESL